ncbi:MAG: DUF2059 domain-containing protein [Rhodospirillales bacterium]
MRLRSLLGVLTIAGLIAAASAPARAVDAESIAAAREFMKAIRAESTLDQLMPSISSLIVNLIRQANPGQGQKFAEIVDRHFTPAFNARRAEYLDGLAQVYALNFTAAELRELSTLYSTPTGKKFAEKQGEIAKQSMAFGGRWGQELAREVLRSLEPELRAKGLKAPI